MEWVLLTLVVLLVLCCWALFVSTKSDNKRKQKLLDLLDSKSEHFNYKNLNIAEICLYLDDSNKEIKFVNYLDNPMEVIKYSYQDILEVELIEDGDTITSTSRASQIGSAAVGGILLGGAGALVGSLTGKSKAAKEVQSISIKILVNDNDNPNHEIYFIGSKSHGAKIKRTDPLYEKAITEANYFASKVQLILKNTKDSDTKVTQQKISDNTSNNSITDDLIKLSDLKEKGLISEVEFESAKNKLLDS